MGERNICNTYKCFCCWSERCGPRIPRIRPGTDYLAIPDGADERPKWSVLAGVTSASVQWHNLRILKFGVAASGRVLGNSDDILKTFRQVTPDDDNKEVFADGFADLSSSGGHLHICCSTYPLKTDGEYGFTLDDLKDGFPYTAFSLNLSDNTLSRLGELDTSFGTQRPITAGCGNWLLRVERPRDDSNLHTRGTTRLTMQQLHGQTWVDAASFEFPHQVSYRCDGDVLQGHVVVGDRILVSLRDDVFFCFDCADRSWTRVSLAGKSSNYFPISNRGLYVQEDDMIYFLRYGTLCAYKYSPKEQTIMPPTSLNTLFPFEDDFGHACVVHLVARALCVVWVSMHMPCRCTTRHVLITTLIVKGDCSDAGCFTPTGVDILHSTCRRINMLGTMATSTSLDTLCFLQSYVEPAYEITPPLFPPTIDTASTSSAMMERGLTSEFTPPLLLPMIGELPPMIGEMTYSEIENPDYPDMLPCCRNFTDIQDSNDMVLRDCKMPTKADLYFVSQVDYYSLLHQISISNGKLSCHDTVMEPQCSLNTLRPGNAEFDEPRSWHFIHQGSKLYVIPSFPRRHMYEIDVDGKFYDSVVTKRPAGCFSAVVSAGSYIIGLGDTLQSVFVLNHRTSTWVRLNVSSRSANLSQKINISGFSDLGDDGFIVSDADTCNCFLLDLKRREWNVVTARVDCRVGMLSGRSVYVEGFIYTPWQDGLVAFELVKEHDSYYLGISITLIFPWKRPLDKDCTCFSLVCKDNITDCVVFCVVQGMYGSYGSSSHKVSYRRSSHEVWITTVQVMIHETGRGTKQPRRKVEHVDICTTSVEHQGWLHTSYAFAA